jgi:anti-sigma regulatory factor (Ser/Thr protein kinase)
VTVGVRDIRPKEPSPAATFFLPAERKDGAELAAEINIVAGSPITDCLMSIANGLFAVLNEERQVLALNDGFLKMIGVEDSGAALGLRTGECLRCIHASEEIGGCGTSRYCTSCGAALSIMAATQTRQPQEQVCAMVAERDGGKRDIYFSVRSCPVTIEDRTLLLFFMQDITAQQNKACLDSSFFHDINNILLGLLGKTQMLSRDTEGDEDKVEELYRVAVRLAGEVAIQDSLRKSVDCGYKPLYTEHSVNSVLREIGEIFCDHPLTAGKHLEVTLLPEEAVLTTDSSLVTRIVSNMTTNALEASRVGGAVRVSATLEEHAVTFEVWNEGKIPDSIALRIFQRNFSTKSNFGRGMGTYSMKLFGEQLLRGRVRFESSEAAGTTFTLTLRR